MRTAGVDLSAANERTAAATIEWRGGRARVGAPLVDLDDAALLDVLAGADWVGIDAPFGWPAGMVDAVGSYASEGRWPDIEKADFRYRRTDRFVREAVLEAVGRRLAPLSVSSDRIALTAGRLAGLREAGFRGSGTRFDRAGADCVLEVYPAAALLLWGLERSGYKEGPVSPARRKRLPRGAAQ
jgi:predicted nuclease with RNAse H fold